MELTTEDRERIEQEVAKIYIEFCDYLTLPKALFKMAEYATRYEREKQANELKRLNEIVTRTPHINRIVFLERQLDERRLEKEKLEAEHTELIRRIKSILKASTVHDKISILEELEQLLNSLKK